MTHDLLFLIFAFWFFIFDFLIFDFCFFRGLLLFFDNLEGLVTCATTIHRILPEIRSGVHWSTVYTRASSYSDAANGSARRHKKLYTSHFLIFSATSSSPYLLSSAPFLLSPFLLSPTPTWGRRRRSRGRGCGSGGGSPFGSWSGCGGGSRGGTCGRSRSGSRHPPAHAPPLAPPPATPPQVWGDNSLPGR